MYTNAAAIVKPLPHEIQQQVMSLDYRTTQDHRVLQLLVLYAFIYTMYRSAFVLFGTTLSSILIIAIKPRATIRGARLHDELLRPQN